MPKGKTSVVDQHVDRHRGLDDPLDAVRIVNVEGEHAQTISERGSTSSFGMRMVAMTFQWRSGLADDRLVLAIRAMHEQLDRNWTVAQLASEAALSRSAFFERFNRTVGVAPMAYLLAWRMALGKQLLRQNETGVAAIAERIGYSSASTFSVAFSRHVGQTPAHYAREHVNNTGQDPADEPVFGKSGANE